MIASFALAGCTDPTSTESEDLGEAQEASVVCEAGQTVPGIDVSVWQANIDWDAVKGKGIVFAFARAAYSTSKDDYFDQNWAGMKSAGIIRGAYQYWRPDKDPIAQADALLNIMGPLEPGDLPPVIDVEETDGVGPTTLSDRLGQWLQHVESKIGRKPIIYSGKYFWQDNVQSKAFLDYPYWIPNYSLDCPNLPDGYWPDWQFFQYSSTGSVPGISGNVDMDKFNGSLLDLQKFAGSAPKYAAKFVAQSFPYAADPPMEMVGGNSYKLSITLKNTGTETWDSNTKLATTEPRDRESPFAGPEWPGPNRYAAVQGTVAPGEDYTFEWEMHAPKKGGTFDEHMGLVQEGVAWFSDEGQGGPPDGQLEGMFHVQTNWGPRPGVVAGGMIGIDWHPPATNEGGSGATQDSGGCSTTGSRLPGDGGLFLTAMTLFGLAMSRRRNREAADRR
ncbi:MAG: GH25 family lysozyme [Polyangiaceae bacterium]